MNLLNQSAVVLLSDVRGVGKSGERKTLPCSQCAALIKAGSARELSAGDCGGDANMSANEARKALGWAPIVNVPSMVQAAVEYETVK